MDEDDLTALRSAALASLSSKDTESTTASGPVTSRDEEDLDALRKAALMTRKQKQIQVIHRPVETNQRPIIPLPLPIAPSLKNWHRNAILCSARPSTFQGPPPPSFMPPSNLRPIITRVPVPRLPVHKVLPRVIAVTDPRINLKKPVIKVPNSSLEMEQKVPDKFSRYDPDSSSEDDEEHSTAKKKNEDVSDAESVISKKSFSSASDTNDNLKATAGISDEKEGDNKGDSKQDQDITSDPGTPLQDEAGDDDISIIGDDEDDDILAAIDDFLEDRPEKKEPKKVARKNSNKKEKPKPTPIVFEKTSILKQNIVKESRPVDSPSDSSKLEEKKIAKVKQSDKPIRSGVQPVTTIKLASQGRGNSSQRKNDFERRQTRTTAPVSDRGSNEAYGIPVVSKRNAPSPRRQRRNSDLDSVGTSDLSFLSSDEDQRKNEQKKEPRKRPRTRSVSDEMERRRNERLKKESRFVEICPSDAPSKSKTSSQSSVKNQGSEHQVERDLRKKLESKGVKRVKIAPDCQGAQSVKEPKSRPDKGNAKRGVISLKSKSSDSSSQSAKLSSKGADRKIVVIAKTQRNAKSAICDTQRSRHRQVAVRTPHKDIAGDKMVKRMKFSEVSPIVAPTNVKVVMQPVPRKTVRLDSEEKPVLPKPSKKSTSKIDDHSRKEISNIKERSAAKELNESYDDLFHEEEIFSFANQEIADFDDVLGDMTEEVEITPKVRRKFSYNASKGKKSDTFEAAFKARSTVDDFLPEKEPKVWIKGSREEEKGTIHHRLGRQVRDANVNEPTEFDTEMLVSNKRRVLVSRISSSPEDNRLSSKSRSVRDRLGKPVKLPKPDQNATSKRNTLKSRRSAKVSLKLISKKSASPSNKESVLEKKIQRIKQRNGEILKRQMEIEREKEKFG